MKKAEGKYNSNFIVGCIMVGLVLLFVIIGRIHTPYDPNKMNAALKTWDPRYHIPLEQIILAGTS